MLSAGVCNSAIRLGGFGPMFNGKHLTSCFNDVILLPLPTWLLLVVGLPLLYSTRAFSQHYHNATATKTGLLSRIITIICRLLVLALLLMDILEITRLVLSNSGIGLLPFNLAGVLIVMVILGVRWRKGGSPRVARGILIAYWGSLIAVQAVKVTTLIYVEKLAVGAGSLGPSQYPNSDNSLDNYVILGLYAVLFLYESFHLFDSSRAGGPISRGELENVNSNGNASLVEQKGVQTVV